MRPRCNAKWILSALVVLFCLLPAAAQAQTQEPALPLRLSRTFGYGGGGRIQGVFTLSVPEQPGLVEVDFLVDGQVVASAAAPPFTYRFNTAEFEPGPHTLSAVGRTADGQALVSNAYPRQFLTSAEAWRATRDLLVPLLAFVGLAVVVSALVPALLSRRQGTRPGAYGAAGGAVCPRCELPYARHFLAPNLLVGKLARCPNCGKWAVVARASPQALQAAEARWAAQQGEAAAQPQDEGERRRRALEDSRFEE
jgi:hypothetical protein